MGTWVKWDIIKKLIISLVICSTKSKNEAAFKIRQKLEKTKPTVVEKMSQFDYFISH
jgi:hypothetical protein